MVHNVINIDENLTELGRTYRRTRGPCHQITSQLAITFWILTIKTQEQGAKYVQS